MADYLQMDAKLLRAEIAKLLDANPELAEDEELRADMLEGETDIKSIVARLVRRKLDARALASAGKEIRNDQSERVKRFERQEEGYDNLIQAVLHSADLPKLVLPEATVSLTKPRSRVNVIDIDALPQGFFVTERKAKSAEIKAALEAGETIPGAELALGDEGLMVRTR